MSLCLWSYKVLKDIETKAKFLVYSNVRQHMKSTKDIPPDQTVSSSCILLRCTLTKQIWLKFKITVANTTQFLFMKREKNKLKCDQIGISSSQPLQIFCKVRQNSNFQNFPTAPTSNDRSYLSFQSLRIRVEKDLSLIRSVVGWTNNTFMTLTNLAWKHWFR